MAVPLHIYYPNGGTRASQMFIVDSMTGEPVAWDGSISIGSITIGEVDQGEGGLSPWLVHFDNTSLAVTGPLTDTQLRATAVPVSGTVTANAGTNLNTSLLALEAGGNLAAAAASLSVLDDWDETDRAKVNPIVGQAGVQGASGAVSNNTQRVVLAIDVALPAGTNLLGSVAPETNTIFSSTTALTVKFAKISTSSSGASTLVAAVTSKKIRVTEIVMMANAAVNVKFQSHVTPTDLTGLLYLAANTGFAPGYDPTGHFETISGEALDINLSGAIAVGGWLKYIEV